MKTFKELITEIINNKNIKKYQKDSAWLPSQTKHHSHLKKLYNEKLYNDNEKEAINDYSSELHQSDANVNKALLEHHMDRFSGHTPESYMKSKNLHTEHRIYKHLNSAIDKSPPLNRNLVTYSGTGEWNVSKENSIDEHNNIIHTPAFTSTSLDPEVATGFIKESFPPEKDHNDNKHYHSNMLVFHLPKGYKKGIYIDHMNMHHGELGFPDDREYEYTLKPNQKWKITHHITHTTEYDMDNATHYHHTHMFHVEPHEED
jgi:hypothetical protein